MSGEMHAQTSQGDGSDRIPLSGLTRRFLPLLAPYTWQLGVLVALVLISPALNAAQIRLLGFLVDDVAASGQPRLLAIFCVAYFGLALLGAGLNVCHRYLRAWLGQHVTLDVRLAMYRRIVAAPPDSVGGTRRGDLLTRLGSDSGSLSTLLIGTPMSLIGNSAALIVYGGALLATSGWAAAVLLLVLPPLWLITRYFAAHIREATREVRAHASRTTSAAEDTLSALPSIQGSSDPELAVRQYDQQLQKYLRARLDQIWLGALNGPAIGLLGTGLGLLIVWLGGERIVEGRMTLGELVAALGYVRSLYRPLFALARLSGQVQQVGVSVERVAEVLDLPTATLPAAPGSPSTTAV